MDTVIQLIVNGLLLGGVLALSALGFNIIFGVMRVVNLAHGDLVVIAALTCAVAYARWHINPLLLLPFTALGGFILGAAIQRFLLRRLPAEIASGEASSLTLTFGLSYFLAGAGLWIFGGQIRSVPYLTGAIQLGAVSVPQARLLAFVAAILIAALLGVFLRYTPIGRAIRATSMNLDGALACGVDADFVRTISFGLGSAVAAAAGTLLSYIYTFNPQDGIPFTISAFAVIAIGGLGSYTGVLLGALVLGFAQAFASYYAGSTLADAAPYVLFVLVMLVLPQGILGRRTA
ncbi:MAG TPA: branched-chain amino acid ABC transporter permease [Candidatus Lustribacter sp.]